MIEKNCVDMVIPLVQELDAEGLHFQIMGGIGSVALANEFVALPNDQLIETREEIRLSQFRENKTLRDVDVLVLSSDDTDIEKVELITQEVIGDELEISVFGLKNSWDLARQKDHPLRSLGMVHLADRYVGLHGVADCQKALYPFKAALNPEILETWYVPVIRGGQVTSIPIPHPGASILNYVTRSVSGIRPKDEAKLTKIVDNVTSNFADITEWIHDGPGSEQLEFARILHSLRQPSHGTAQDLTLGTLLKQPALDLASVMSDSTYSMASDLPVSMQRTILSVMRAKARIIHWGESNEHIVRMFQDVFEKKFDKIVKNK